MDQNTQEPSSMDLNNRLTEDETLEQAYDIFLELAGITSIQPIFYCLIFSLKSAVALSCLIRRRIGRSMSILT